MSAESLRAWPSLDGDISVDASTDIRQKIEADDPPAKIHVNSRALLPQESKRIQQSLRRAGYEVASLLDEHENSLVYLARSLATGENVVAKVMVDRAYAASSALLRFHLEASALSTFEHPNLARVTDHGVDANINYMILEYVEGVNLANRIAHLGALTAPMAIHCITQAASALTYLHRQGVIHRDVKPANLVMSLEGRVMLIDLGLARMSDGATGSITRLFNDKYLGTADYMAPEQALDSHQVDPRADIYSLGCTLYFLLSGRAPFHGDTLAARLMEHQVCAPPILKCSQSPQRLAAVCLRMMAKDPAERFPSAADVVHELAKCSS